MKKQLQLFLTLKDEKEFSEQLKQICPGIYFINSNLWLNGPEYRDSISHCESLITYLYLGLPKDLPTLKRKDGKFEGPNAGCVIQIIRSLKNDRVLFSGRIAFGIFNDDTNMLDFATKVWKTILRMGERGVKRPDGRVDRNYLVGKHARLDVLESQITLADRAVMLPYTLP